MPVTSNLREQIKISLNGDERATREMVGLLEDASESNLPYSIYSALLNQTGINPPVATVLENTFSGASTVFFTRQGTGRYLINRVGIATDPLKVQIFIGGNSNTALVTYEVGVSDADNLYLDVRDNQVFADDKVFNFPIEIRLYP